MFSVHFIFYFLFNYWTVLIVVDCLMLVSNVAPSAMTHSLYMKTYLVIKRFWFWFWKERHTLTEQSNSTIHYIYKSTIFSHVFLRQQTFKAYIPKLHSVLPYSQCCWLCWIWMDGFYRPQRLNNGGYLLSLLEGQNTSLGAFLLALNMVSVYRWVGAICL